MLQKVLCLLFMLLCLPGTAFAHVKWFSPFSFTDKPLSLSEVLSPTFLLLLGLSLVFIQGLVILDIKWSQSSVIKKLTDQLDKYQGHSLVIMRAAAAAVLLMSFQAEALFVPELKEIHPVVGWLQFLFAVLLLFPKTVVISGWGILGLCAYGFNQFGWFHMLDYVLFVGVGYYLVVQSSKVEKLQGSGLVALYITAGFSLCWVAIEKLLYPQWAIGILEQNPQLALGLDFNFFLMAAAFVEFSLGYLMIICLLQRPLALVVTVVFFMTTLVFGRMEVVGHTIIHAVLIVFIIEGAGRVFKSPINFHNRLGLKIAFAVVNFVILLGLLIVPYQRIAAGKHAEFLNQRQALAIVETEEWERPPEIQLAVLEDNNMGWNVHVKVKNFSFAPQNSGQQHVDGEGHGHIYVDDKKVGRVYGDWHYLSGLTPGKHTVKVSLNSNDHKMYVYQDNPIEDSIVVEVGKGQMKMDHQ